MNVKSYEKSDDYYRGEVCQKSLCSAVDNLIEIKEKRNIPRNKLMYYKEDEGLYFLPARVVESDLLLNVKETLEESTSCWQIDPCHKKLKKYCCDETVSSSSPAVNSVNNSNSNNAFLYILLGAGFLLFIIIAIYMLFKS